MVALPCWWFLDEREMEGEKMISESKMVIKEIRKRGSHSVWWESLLCQYIRLPAPPKHPIPRFPIPSPTPQWPRSKVKVQWRLRPHRCGVCGKTNSYPSLLYSQWTSIGFSSQTSICSWLYYVYTTFVSFQHGLFWLVMVSDLTLIPRTGTHQATNTCSLLQAGRWLCKANQMTPIIPKTLVSSHRSLVS